MKGRDVAVVELARAHGVDLISGCGLAEALEGVDIVIDVSNPTPTDTTPTSRTPSPPPPATWWMHAPRKKYSDWWF